MSDLESLTQLCSVSKFECGITINPHTMNSESIREYVEGQFEDSEIDPSILDKCISENILVEAFSYPTSWGSFYKTFHNDISEAIKPILNELKENK